MIERISDQQQRDAALDPRRSFIVQAPAGSGKTELLVQRYIRLLGTVQKPEEILAITFTIKAAAEMRKRVLENLSATGKNPGDIAHRLKIQTIDAFCASLVRQMPVTSKFGAQPAVVEDATEHYREAAMRTLEELTPAAGRVLLHLDNNMDAAADQIASMLARRDQWLRKAGSAPSRNDLEAALRRERNRLLAHARLLHPKASPEFAQAMLTQKLTWRKNDPEAQSLSDDEPLRQALARVLSLPPEHYTDEQWQVLGAMLELLPRAGAQLKVVFAERGETDFTEIAQGAVRALGTPEEPTDLLLALDTRIQHILVDEFQDTSVSQFDLLERLTAGWEAEDGRTLFLVGDPMQSIYRFREAEVALFLDAWSEGLGTVKLERLTLTTNFRSQPRLVDWFNASFREILPREADRPTGAVPYSAATAHPDKEALEGEPVAWHHVADRVSESRRIVDLVKQAHGRSAILVRKRDALADIVPALKAAGIRYRAIEIESLGEKQVVQDLYALTRALTHLGDRIAWLAILRAPWLGLSLQQLLEISGRDRFKTLWELIKDDLFLSSFTSILAPAIENRRRGSLRERVEGVWLALGGPACVQDKTDLEDAEIYLDELERLETAGIVPDFAALAESLDKLYALPDVEATDEDLQIMTIHKAKGLEFDTVIVPGLDRGPGRSDPPMFLWKELLSRPPVKGGSEPSGERGVAFSDASLLFAPMRPTGGDRDPTYDYLRDLDSEAEDMEASRLLYVAATRAKNHLHLLACLECDKDGEMKKPFAHSLLERAWPVAAPYFTEPQPVRRPRAGEDPVSIFTINRLARDFRMPSLPSSAQWTAPPEGREEEQIEFSWAGETARHVGTVAHRWLQRIAGDELKGWDAKRIDSLVKNFHRELQRRGVPSSAAYSATELVRTALKNCVTDERGRWVLDAHGEARSEYRLRVRANDGVVRTYVMDRIFRDERGDQWIVDFKTSRHEGAALEQFLDEERKRYEQQLNTYALAVGPTNLGLYFPLLKGWREWSKQDC
ncbi:MAG TPA: UvrD-helicase domain-containing protein [Burkholderiales bacterium]|nr:UvrD-helicase domain-containing protein [Burkholderiales bacterium]